MKKTASLALTLLALAAPLIAGELQIDLDPELTSISFRLQATLHSVHGSAALTAGSLRLNTESGDMTGAVTIDATTAETGNKKRDKKMHGKVLATADHPKIVLRTRRLDGELALQGVSDVTLHGAIEILGQSHEIGVPAHIEIDRRSLHRKHGVRNSLRRLGARRSEHLCVTGRQEVVQVTVDAAGTVVVPAQ